VRQFLTDLRYGARTLAKSKGFTLIAVVTLALCVGANTAIFTLVNAVLLRPLPYPHADRLMWVSEFLPHIHSHTTIGPDYVAWRDHAKSFEKIAAYDSDNFNASGAGEPVRVEAGEVTSTFFPLFNVRPILGRPFNPEEDEPGAAAPVVLLTYGFWRDHFGAQSDAIGKSLVLNGQAHTVVGVLPADFCFPENDIKPDLLRPLALPPYQSTDTSFRNVRTAGLLARSASMQQATAELNAINSAIHGTDKSASWLEGMYAEMVPLQEHIVGDTRRSLWMLLVAVGFVLLIGCVNIANLQLARASGRRREIAVRTALGAGRIQLVRLLLTENLLLASAGGALGFFLADWLVKLARNIQVEALPRVSPIRIDVNVFAFTLLVVVIAGLAFGSGPAIFSTKRESWSPLESAGIHVSSGKRHRHISSILVVSELALALVLLVGAGLLIRTFLGILRTDPGFRCQGLLTARIVLSEHKYPGGEQRRQFFEQLLPRIEALPGVEAAGVSSSLPLAGHAMHGAVQAEGQPEVPPSSAPSIFIDGITPGYFHAMGMPLLKGRDFSPEDAQKDAAPKVILNQAAANTFFPGQDAVGKHIRMARDKEWPEIIAVVGDVRDNGLDQENSTQMYLPIILHVSNIAIRTAGDPAALAGLLRQEVQSVDPDQPIFDVMTMETRVSESLQARRFTMLLLTAFAALALCLAAIGIYGVISYTVAQRTREIGIRLALGANPEKVLQLVMANGMTLCVIGVVLGLGGALALSRLMAGLLYGVAANDAVTLLSASAVLIVAALLASFFPARRAAQVNPAVTLRYE